MKRIIKSLISNLGYRLEKVHNKGRIQRNRFEPYECTFQDHTLYVHDHDSFELGNEELFGVNKIYKFNSLNDKPYIIDCGANMGMSLIYFKSLYPDAEITAFEADPHIFSFLKKNVQSFNFSDTRIINKAVWHTNGETLSFLSEGGAGGRLQARSGEHKFVEVQTVRLKDYLNRKVDFLKIDIEGAEYPVIKDCSAELVNVQNLFIEYHGFPDVPQNLHLILEIVKNAGFSYHIREAFASPEPLIERQLNFGMDLQLNIFCYRN